MIQAAGPAHYRLAPGVEIEHRFWARLPAGMAKLKMRGFCEQHRAVVLQQSGQRWLVEIPARTTLLQRCLGRAAGMLVEVAIGRPRESLEIMSPVRVRLEPRDCARGRADELLAEVGPVVLDSLQTYFSGQSTKQAQERYPLTQAVHVQALNGASVTGRTRDVGREAMGLLSPCELPLGPVKLTINRWGSPLTVRVPGRVHDCAAADGGRYEVEVGLG